jgi:hypothetical protein
VYLKNYKEEKGHHYTFMPLESHPGASADD